MHLPRCDLPAAWDHLRLVFARSMGPPGLPVTGPPAGSARLCGSSDPERSDRLSYREVSVVEVQEVLRAWLSGAGARPAAERAGVNVKTARRYIEAAVAAGLVLAARFPEHPYRLFGSVLLRCVPSGRPRRDRGAPAPPLAP